MKVSSEKVLLYKYGLTEVLTSQRRYKSLVQTLDNLELGYGLFFLYQAFSLKNDKSLTLPWSPPTLFWSSWHLSFRKSSDCCLDERSRVPVLAQVCPAWLPDAADPGQGAHPLGRRLPVARVDRLTRSGGHPPLLPGPTGRLAPDLQHRLRDHQPGECCVASQLGSSLQRKWRKRGRELPVF